MLVELLLCIALAAVMIPFIFQYQANITRRAKNVSIANNMEMVQTALERYIVAHRADLMKTVGRTITRVELSELSEYGLNDDFIDTHLSDYQLRILKSQNTNDRASLQGVVVLSDSDITPMRTREIVNLAGGDMGFIDNKRAYGAFGAWRSDAVDLGIGANDGIVGVTGITHDNALYLWRVPSDNIDDATMISSLALGGHDIINTKYFDARAAQFDETLTAQEISTDNLIFQNRTTVDNKYKTQNAVCSGILSSDSRNMDVTGTLTISDVAKFASFTTDDLWVSNLTLAGLTISDTSHPAILKINQALDMVSGHIDAMYVSVGFSGSISPRLVVRNMITDSINSDYYWDVSSGVANFADLSLVELTQMASTVVRRESDTSTISTQVFGAVVANKNATVSDFMNAIVDIQKRVRAKYRMLQSN